MPRVSWQLPAAAFLLVLLATLATLQYRWLGEVSQAEGERMRANIRTRVSDFTQEFDREVSRTYLAFQIGMVQFNRDPAAALATAYQRWQTAAPAPALIRGLYLVDGATFVSGRLQRFDPEARTLQPSDWPADLMNVKSADRPLPLIIGTAPLPFVAADAVNARDLALIVPLPGFATGAARIDPGRKSSPTQRIAVAAATSSGRALIVQLDAEALQRQLLQPLVAKYFGDGDAAEYLVTITTRADPPATIFSSSGGRVDAGAADVTAGLFDVRLDEINRLALVDLPPRDAASAKSAHMAITIVRRDSRPDSSRRLASTGDSSGAWQMRVRHRDGSLEAVLARSRRRNLAISLGVLGLLGASFALLITASRRQQQLSRQQMEFVASISHELRTPLAVICSAGENLADGVVAESEQVRKYGALIEGEGRRLGDMVERVMAFAGINAGSAVRTRPDVSVLAVVEAAIDGAAPEARERGITIKFDAGDALAPICGDPDALRSAVQNIVGNAIKYSPAASAVDVVLRSEKGSIRIDVADRGLGIDASDLPHIFKPFFRGRRAVDAQVRGSGVGLSVVRHVVDGHHGRIAVESRVGEGTTVSVVLPV